MTVDEPQAFGRHKRLALSESDSDDEVQNILTTAKASDLCPKPYRLIARQQNITSLGDLSALTALDYIDVSGNSLHSLQGIDHPRLKTLNVAHNKLSQVAPIYKSSSIRILNVSSNTLPSLEWLSRASFSAQLLTLVASANSLRSLEGVSALSSIHTLIISNNELEDLSPVTNLVSLVKLSVSGNSLRRLPSLARLEKLVELRLAHNRIVSLPDCRLTALRILDLGHNRLASLENLDNFAPGLKHVNMRKNPVCEQDEYMGRLKRACPDLEVIDGQRLAGGRRKLRVNRIRKSVGFECEDDRKFARMPSAYYLKTLKDKGLIDESHQVSIGEHDNGDQKGVSRNARYERASRSSSLRTVEAEKRERASQPKEEGRQSDDAGEKDIQEMEIDAESFVTMAKEKGRKRDIREDVEIKVHLQKTRDDRRGVRKKAKRSNHGGVGKASVESFGEGGASKW